MQDDPDEKPAADVLASVSVALATFFTNPVDQDGMEWLQCLRCLQISHSTVTKDHWMAQLFTCDDNADAARHSILNAHANQAQKETMQYMVDLKARADNQVVEWITNDDLAPAFNEEPRLVEWAQ
jgi:hypothetical protein